MEVSGHILFTVSYPFILHINPLRKNFIIGYLYNDVKNILPHGELFYTGEVLEIELVDNKVFAKTKSRYYLLGGISQKEAFIVAQKYGIALTLH